MKIKIILLILTSVLFVLAYFTLINLGHVNNGEKLVTGQVIINNQVINVEIAQTVNQQVQGLSHRKSLAADSGMLFVFPDLRIRNFWMKDMEFPLDMIWIRDDTIIGFETNVLVPLANQQVLPVYISPREVNYVLEVNGGFAEKNKIQVGDNVTYKLK